MIGFIPLFGEAADLINAGFYYYQGEEEDAILCLASMIPVVGDVAFKGSKYLVKAAASGVSSTAKLFDLSKAGLRHFGEGAKLLKKVDGSVCTECLEDLGRILETKPEHGEKIIELLETSNTVDRRTELIANLKKLNCAK
ncbi:MAG: hypothetical protein AAF705_13230 [Bacteroidota bacterium]